MGEGTNNLIQIICTRKEIFLNIFFTIAKSLFRIRGTSYFLGLPDSLLFVWIRTLFFFGFQNSEKNFFLFIVIFWVYCLQYISHT
jgi:hypothetical protein